jgi:hypothetical protein
MKLATLLFALTLAATAQADTTQTWNISTSCNPTFFIAPPPCQQAANINAVFTTTLESGTFYEEVSDQLFTGSAFVVTSISGTFDGLPMSLVVLPQVDWMNGELPENIWFSAGGAEYALLYDGLFTLAPASAVNQNTWEYLNWNATDPAAVPEPSTLLLLTVPLLLALMLWARKSLRRVY